MSLAQVRNLVRHDRREFVLGDGVLKQATVHTDDSAGHGEGVDGGVIDDDQLDAAVLKFAMLHQFEDEALEIAVEQWVGCDGRLSPKAAEPHATQLVLVVRRKQACAGLAQIGDFQIIRRRPTPWRYGHRAGQ